MKSLYLWQMDQDKGTLQDSFQKAAGQRLAQLGVRGVSRLDLKANSEPGTAEHGLPQALGTGGSAAGCERASCPCRPAPSGHLDRPHARPAAPASPCERRGGRCSVQKKFSAIVEETAAVQML